jgi:hypothetical protein
MFVLRRNSIEAGWKKVRFRPEEIQQIERFELTNAAADSELPFCRFIEDKINRREEIAVRTSNSDCDSLFGSDNPSSKEHEKLKTSETIGERQRSDEQ